MAVYLANVVSGDQPLPSKAELIDSRTFTWTYQGLHADAVAVDLPLASGRDAQKQLPDANVSKSGDAGKQQISISATSGTASARANSASKGQAAAAQPPAYVQAAKDVSKREFWGIGTPGTETKFTVPALRVLILAQVCVNACTGERMYVEGSPRAAHNLHFS